MSRADICPAPSHVRELVFAAVGDGRDWVSVTTPPHAPSFLTPRVQGFLVVRLLFLLLVQAAENNPGQAAGYEDEPGDHTQQ